MPTEYGRDLDSAFELDHSLPTPLMSGKRKAEEAFKSTKDVSSKKQRIFAARTIASQQSTATVSSKTTDSLTGLPSSIDVEKFAEVRMSI